MAQVHQQIPRRVVAASGPAGLGQRGQRQTQVRGEAVERGHGGLVVGVHEALILLAAGVPLVDDALLVGQEAGHTGELELGLSRSGGRLGGGGGGSRHGCLLKGVGRC